MSRSSVQLMRQRLFGDAHWMGLTRARSHMYTYDVVLSRRIKHVVHNQLTAVKEDRAPNFNKDFPTLARKFKDNHSQKVRFTTCSSRPMALYQIVVLDVDCLA